MNSRPRFLNSASSRPFALAILFLCAGLLTGGPGLGRRAAAAQSPQAAPDAPALAPGAESFTTSSSSSEIPEAMKSLDNEHRLAIGDRVSFRILEDEEEPRPLIVTDSGEIETPYIGRFQAKGKTCRELALQLKKELEKEYYYQATVILAVDQMARSRGKVYLVGPVRLAGPQEIPSDEVFTLSKAILRAGGFLDSADKKNVRVTRKADAGAVGESGEQRFTVNVADILEKGRTENDIVLQPGDLVYIPERLIRL
jgi:polysaccharide export outer membrane protein